MITDFSLIERLAILKSLDDLILANEETDQGELEYLEKVMFELDFQKDILVEARKMRSSDCVQILQKMNEYKKQYFIETLHQMAIADGFADETEINLIILLYERMGLNKNEELLVMDFPNLNYLLFTSQKQFIYPTGFFEERKIYNKSSTVKIESEVDSTDLFNVSIFAEVSTPKLWGLDIIFPTHRMKRIKIDSEYIELHSVDREQNIKIFYEGPNIEKVRLTDESKALYVEYL